MKYPHEEVLSLVKETGVGRLAGHDGCVCGFFSVRNVNVDIACGKGRDRGIWVYSNSMDYVEDTEEKLRPIAEEVKKYVEDDGRGDALIHFHEWNK